MRGGVVLAGVFSCYCFSSWLLKLDKLLAFSGNHLRTACFSIFHKIMFSFQNPSYRRLLNILYYSGRKDLQGNHLFSFCLLWQCIIAVAVLLAWLDESNYFWGIERFCFFFQERKFNYLINQFITKYLDLTFSSEIWGIGTMEIVMIMLMVVIINNIKTWYS